MMIDDSTVVNVKELIETSSEIITHTVLQAGNTT